MSTLSINGIPLSNFKAILLSKDIQTADVTIYDDWLRTALNPLYFGKQETYRQIKLSIGINGDNEEDCLIQISNLVAQLEKCTLQFSDMKFLYDCTINSKSSTRVSSTFYTLDVELKAAYAYTAQESIDIVGKTPISSTIHVDGNMPAPAILTLSLTGSDTYTTLTFTGFTEKPFIINNVIPTETLTIDGVKGMVLEDEDNYFYYAEDFWEFPRLNPGDNNINLSGFNSSATFTLNVKYNPRWL